MSDLVSRLLAAIEETERLANAATPGPWRVDNESYAEAIYGGEVGCVVGGGRWGGEASVFDSTEDALHIVHNDPAAVLRRCAADRDIVEWCTEVIGDRDLSTYGEFGSLKGDPQSLAVTLSVETLRNLAAGYGISTQEEPPGSVAYPS